MTAVHLAHFPADEPLSRVASVLIGLLVIGMALAAAAVGLMMNIDFATREGLDIWKTSAYAGADVAEFMMPVVIMAMGWPWYKRAPALVVWMVFLAISSFCIFSSVAEVEAQKLKASAVIENVYRQAEGRKAAADATLADPNVAREHTSVAELELLAKEASSAAEREGARGTCASKCEAAHTEHRKFLERVGLAKSRDAANATLKEVAPILVKGLPDPAGFAVILAGPLGLNVKTLSKGHSMATSLGAVVAVKLAVLFFSPVGAWLLFRGGRRKVEIKGRNAPLDRAEPTLGGRTVNNVNSSAGHALTVDNMHGEDAEFGAPAEPVRMLTQRAEDMAAEPTKTLGGKPAISEVKPDQDNDLALAETAAVVGATEAPELVHATPAPPVVDERPTATVTKLTPPPKVEETGQGADVRTWLRETLAKDGPTLRSELIAAAAPRFSRHAVTRAISRLECKVDDSVGGKRDALISLPRRKRDKIGF